jgi:hypothetical protein
MADCGGSCGCEGTCGAKSPPKSKCKCVCRCVPYAPYASPPDSTVTRSPLAGPLPTATTIFNSSGTPDKTSQAVQRTSTEDPEEGIKEFNPWWDTKGVSLVSIPGDGGPTAPPPAPPGAADRGNVIYHGPVLRVPPTSVSEITFASLERRMGSIASRTAVEAVSVVPPVPERPTVSAADPVVARPMVRMEVGFLPTRTMAPGLLGGPGAEVQGETGQAFGHTETAVLERASGGTVYPPDAVRIPGPMLPRRVPLAPPHAGDFRLGGPDALPGSGIGAPRFPVPGRDGYPLWTPDVEVARKAEGSDIDAHRVPMALRLPSMGIEGDVGPGPLAPAWKPKVPAWEKPPALFLPIPPMISPPALTVASAPPSIAVRPPTGPWGGKDAFYAPPMLPGLPAGGPVEAPPAGATEATAPAGGSAMRPAQEDVQAFKAAMRGPVPVDQWRPPKPEMPGAPGGERGGRGTSIASLATAKDYADAYKAERDRLKDYVAMTAMEAEAKHDQESADRAFAAMGMLEKAEVAFEESLEPLKAAGTDYWKRLEEDQDRRDAAYAHEKEREAKKLDTRPNYMTWAVGNSTMKESREVRGKANENQAAAGRLGRDADPAAVKAAKTASREAKAAAKEAKKAGKRAKDAAKYGTKEEARKAAVKANDLANKAKQALGESDKKLQAAKASANKDPKIPQGKAPGSPSTGPGTSIPVANVPDVFHVCGNPNPGCDDVELDCSPWPGTVRRCEYVLVSPDEGDEEEDADGTGSGGGSKGKGHPLVPGDPGLSPGMDWPNAVPSDSTLLYSPLLMQDEGSRIGSSMEEAAQDLEGSPLEDIPADKMKYFSSGALAYQQHDGQWILLPPEVAQETVEFEDGSYVFSLDRFTNAIASAAQVNILERNGIEDFDGSFEEFRDQFKAEYEEERSRLMGPYRIEESDLRAAIPLTEAINATKDGAKQLWEVSRALPPVDLLHDIVDVSDALSRGELAEAGLTATLSVLPFSSKLAKQALKSLKGEEKILEVGKKVDVVATGNLRKDLTRGLEGGVDLPGERKRLTSSIVAHHPVVQQFRARLAKLGIMADRYGAWAEGKTHRILHSTKRYNARFKKLLDDVEMLPSREATKRIEAFIKREASELGLTIYILMGKGK